jgi:hypothetical protein
MPKPPPSPSGLNRGDVRGYEHQLPPGSSILRARRPYGVCCVQRARHHRRQMIFESSLSSPACRLTQLVSNQGCQRSPFGVLPLRILSSLPFGQWGMKPTLSGGHSLEEQQLSPGRDTRGPTPGRFRAIYHQGFAKHPEPHLRVGEIPSSLTWCEYSALSAAVVGSLQASDMFSWHCRPDSRGPHCS